MTTIRLDRRTKSLSPVLIAVITRLLVMCPTREEGR